MPEFPIRLALLLLPVLALLSVGLLRRRRIRYPHLLFVAASGSTRASLLLRRLRLFYDAILDAAAALLIAAALGGWPGPRVGPPAFVLDWSFSMSSGLPGSRPIDAALAALRRDPDAREADFFLLRTDPRTGEGLVEELTEVLGGGGDPVSVVALLGPERPFLGSDPSLLSRLSRASRRRIVYACDELGPEAGNFELIETAWVEREAAVLARSGWDAASKGYVAWLAQRGPPGAREEPLVYEVPGRPGRPLGPDRVLIEAAGGGWRLGLSRPGAYLVQGPQFSTPLVVAEAPSRPSGTGRYSEALAALFGFLPQGGRTLALVDGRESGPGRIATLPPPDRADEAGLRLAEPATTRGQVLALRAVRGADLALDARSVENEALPLAYWTRIENAALSGAKPRDEILVRAGDGLIAQAPDGGLRAIVPPPGEYARPLPGGRLTLAAPEPRRWPLVLLLGLLAAAKLGLALAFGGASPPPAAETGPVEARTAVVKRRAPPSVLSETDGLSPSEPPAMRARA